MPLGEGTSQRQALSLHPGAHARAGRLAAFTLIETLVVVSIIAILMASLLPVLGGVRGRMHTLKCSSNLRTVGLQFQLFAEGVNPGGRGDSDKRGRGFAVNDFQDYLYRIDEFWNVPNQTTATLDRGDEPAICPAAPGPLQKRSGRPCGRESVTPLENVTLAVNMRLYQATVPFRGRPTLALAASTRVRTDILNHPYVPLVFDVNAKEALSRRRDPFYSAPPPRSGAPDGYSDGEHWMPGDRHGGKVNVAFVGGHVLTSLRPEAEPWDWTYQAHAGN